MLDENSKLKDTSEFQRTEATRSALEKFTEEEIGKKYFKEGYEMGTKVYKDVCVEERNKTFLEILNKLEEYLPDAWQSEQCGVEKAIRLISKLR